MKQKKKAEGCLNPVKKIYFLEAVCSMFSCKCIRMYLDPACDHPVPSFPFWHTLPPRNPTQLDSDEDLQLTTLCFYCRPASTISWDHLVTTVFFWSVSLIPNLSWHGGSLRTAGSTNDNGGQAACDPNRAHQDKVGPAFVLDFGAFFPGCRCIWGNSSPSVQTLCLGGAANRKQRGKWRGAENGWFQTADELKGCTELIKVGRFC